MTISEDRLKILTTIANKVWNRLYQVRYNEMRRTIYGERTVGWPYPHSYPSYYPDMVETTVLREPSEWNYFSQTLMKGTCVRNRPCRRNGWEIYVSYVDNHQFNDNDTFAKKWYHLVSTDALKKNKYNLDKEKLVSRIQKCSPANASTAEENVLSQRISQVNEMIQEIIAEKDKHNLEKLQSFELLDNGQFWLIWEGDTRKKPTTKCGCWW
jgi:hypothetical protein